MTTFMAMAIRNRARGGHWFEHDSMELFGTRFESDPDLIGDEYYFITSEQDRSGDPSRSAWEGVRRYTIRAEYKGRIRTVGEFGEFETLSEAQEALRNIEGEDR